MNDSLSVFVLFDTAVIDDIFIDMLDAIGKGVSVMEIEWGIDTDGSNIIENIEYVHPKKLVWNSQTDEMEICTREFPSGVPLPENKFVVHKYKAKSGHTSRNTPGGFMDVSFQEL